jgi:hypothetical protein
VPNKWDCKSLPQDGHDLSNGYTTRDTQHDKFPMENIAANKCKRKPTSSWSVWQNFVHS